MVNIDYIMELLDWNNDAEQQQEGIRLAREVKCLNAFLQPGAPYSKRVWGNCAKILAERTDEELSWHLLSLLEWLQDMNWPGAFCILDRLKEFEKDKRFDCMLKISRKKARLLQDEVWEENLRMLDESAN